MWPRSREPDGNFSHHEPPPTRNPSRAFWSHNESPGPSFQPTPRPISIRIRRKGCPKLSRSRLRRPPRRACSSSYLVAESGTTTRATPARIDRMALSARRDSGISDSQASTKEPFPLRFRLASRRIADTSPSIPRLSTRFTRNPRRRSSPAAATATPEPEPPGDVGRFSVPDEAFSAVEPDSGWLFAMRSPGCRLLDACASDQCHPVVHDSSTACSRRCRFL